MGNEIFLYGQKHTQTNILTLSYRHKYKKFAHECVFSSSGSMRSARHPELPPLNNYITDGPRNRWILKICPPSIKFWIDRWYKIILEYWNIVIGHISISNTPPLNIFMKLNSCNDYRVKKLPKSYLTIRGIIMQSLKSIGQL